MNTTFQAKLAIFLGLIVGFFIIYISLFSRSDRREVQIIFRYDDFSNSSSEQIEHRILGLIAREGYSCSFGIIPFAPAEESLDALPVTPLDTAKSNLIRDYVGNGSLEVCLHGYFHIQNPGSPVKTEFSGMPAEQQEYRIREAKNYLDSLFHVEVITFIPPWNSYDPATLEVLSDLDFRIISGDNHQPVFKGSSQQLVPFTATLSELSVILDRNIVPSGRGKAFVILMVHDYDFMEVDPEQAIIDLDSFDEAMDALLQRGWKVSSLGNAVGESPRFNNSLYRFNSRAEILTDHLSLLTSRLGILNRLPILNAFYLPGGQILRILLMVVIYYILLALLAGEMTGIILKWIGPGLLPVKLLTLIVAMVTILSSFYFWMDDHTLGKKELTIVVVFAGTLIGLCSGWCRLRIKGYKEKP